MGTGTKEKGIGKKKMAIENKEMSPENKEMGTENKEVRTNNLEMYTQKSLSAEYAEFLQKQQLRRRLSNPPEVHGRELTYSYESSVGGNAKIYTHYRSSLERYR